MNTFASTIRTFSSCSTLKNSIKNVTIIGGGLMGSGIAQVAAQNGNHVTLLDVSENVLKNSEKRIGDSLNRVAKKLHKENPDEAKKFTEETQGRIKYLTDKSKAVENADLLIEAIVENLDLKHALFKEMDYLAGPKTIFASNTSSLLIREIASVTDRKDRFGGLHFFNPVPIMKLLEVVRTPDTSEETHKKLLDWGKSIGKTCITCKDSPGFVVNRLLVPFLAEAVRLYEKGDATAKDIDIAMKLGAGHPMGPFELADYCGHDTTLSVLEGWHKKFPQNSMFKPPESLRKLVQERKLGMKTGEGFYKYNGF